MPEICVKLVEAAQEVCRDRSTWEDKAHLPDTVTMRNFLALVNYGIKRQKEFAVLQKRLLSPKLTQMEIARQLGLNQPEVNKILNSPFVIEVLPKPIWADDDDDEF